MKKISGVLMSFLAVFFLPVIAFAAPETTEENPIKKIGGYMKWKWSVLDGLDFLFSPITLVLTILIITALVVLIWRVITRITKVSAGKAALKDKVFWIEVSVSLLIIFLLFSGALFDMLGNIYNWTNKQDLGGGETALLRVERSINDFSNLV
jgi:hypothetical protein